MILAIKRYTIDIPLQRQSIQYLSIAHIFLYEKRTWCQWDLNERVWIGLIRLDDGTGHIEKRFGMSANTSCYQLILSSLAYYTVLYKPTL